MSECEKYQELISALLDSELSGAESAALAEHLKVCTGCAAMHQAFSTLSKTLSEGLEAPPAALHENIMAGVRRESVKHANLPRISKPMKNILALAACSAIVIGSVFGLAPMFRASSAAPAEYSAAAGGEARPRRPQRRTPSLTRPPPTGETAWWPPLLRRTWPLRAGPGSAGRTGNIFKAVSPARHVPCVQRSSGTSCCTRSAWTKTAAPIYICLKKRSIIPPPEAKPFSAPA